jgi:hypothetical protein
MVLSFSPLFNLYSSSHSFYGNFDRFLTRGIFRFLYGFHFYPVTHREGKVSFVYECCHFFLTVTLSFLFAKNQAKFWDLSDGNHDRLKLVCSCS